MDKCPICLEEIKKSNFAVPSCGHKCCLTCLLKNLSYSTDCPLCRKKIVYRDRVRFSRYMAEDIANNILIEKNVTDKIEMLLRQKILNKSDLKIYIEVLFKESIVEGIGATMIDLFGNNCVDESWFETAEDINILTLNLSFQKYITNVITLHEIENDISRQKMMIEVENKRLNEFKRVEKKYEKLYTRDKLYMDDYINSQMVVISALEYIGKLKDKYYNLELSRRIIVDEMSNCI